MARGDDILAAVQRIHEAPLARDGWERALASIAAATGSQHGIFLVQNANQTIEYATGFEMTSKQVAGFSDGAGPGSAFWETIRTLPVGFVAPTSALLPDREYARTSFYNLGVRPLGAFHGLLVSPLRTPQSFCHLSTGRRLGRDDYDGEDIAAMRALVPHVLTALQVAQRLAAANLSTMGGGQALDRLEAGIILLDAAMKIVFANRTAEAILTSNAGLVIHQEDLCASGTAATRLLHRLVLSCTGDAIVNDGPGGNMELPREGRSSLRVSVTPFRAEAAQVDMTWLGASRPVAILIITDPEREQRSRKENLRRRFELTPAEADVASEIAMGDGRSASAARLGISATTVRAHLSRIFEKTGVRRQAELVRLLMQTGSGQIIGENNGRPSANVKLGKD